MSNKVNVDQPFLYLLRNPFCGMTWIQNNFNLHAVTFRNKVNFFMSPPLTLFLKLMFLLLEKTLR